MNQAVLKSLQQICLTGQGSSSSASLAYLSGSSSASGGVETGGFMYVTLQEQVVKLGCSWGQIPNFGFTSALNLNIEPQPKLIRTLVLLYVFETLRFSRNRPASSLLSQGGPPMEQSPRESLLLVIVTAATSPPRNPAWDRQRRNNNTSVGTEGKLILQCHGSRAMVWVLPASPG